MVSQARKNSFEAPEFPSDPPNPFSVNIVFTTAILSRFAMSSLPRSESIRFREILTPNHQLLKVAGFEPDPTPLCQNG